MGSAWEPRRAMDLGLSWLLGGAGAVPAALLARGSARLSCAAGVVNGRESEVQLIRPSPPQPGSGWDAEIARPDGTRLGVRRDADPAWIAAMAQAVRRPC